MRQKLLAQVEKHRAWAVEIMSNLTAIPALGPDNNGQGEMAKALYLTDVLQELGLNIERVDAPDERVPDKARPNILAWWGEGNTPGCFTLSHMDVVPAGAIELWHSDPWQLKVDGSKLYGRGVADNHDSIVASLLALRAIKELNAPLPGRAGVALVSDEETGSHYGLEYVLKARPDFFSAQDLLIVPDWGDPQGTLIEIAEKSILWIRVEVLGKQAHASMPQLGNNALYAAARMMVEVYKVRDSLPQRMDLFTPPTTTMEPTRKDAGVENINTIPGQDVFYIDCRVLPGIPLEEIVDALKAAFNPIAQELDVSYQFSFHQCLEAPQGTPEDAPVVTALKSALKLTRGLEAHVGGIGGGTVAAFFRQQGLPAVVWNTNHGMAHAPNEWVDLNDIVADAKVFALLFAGLY